MTAAMFALPKQNSFLLVWRAAVPALQTSVRLLAGLASTDSLPYSGLEAMKDNRISNIASKLGIKVEDVLRCIKVSPELLASSPSQWQRCFAELQAHGFHRDDHLKMVTLNPALITMAEHQEIFSGVDMWRSCRMGDENTLHLLSSCPHLLSVKEKEFKQRIPVLTTLVKSNRKHLMRLLIGNPSVMLDNWRNVLAKIDYIKNVMDINIEKENISKTYLFNRDFTELKVRYMFLKRAGIYINPPKIIKGTKVEQMQQPWSKNPILSEIIDTSDETFINKIAKGLSLEELKVFWEVYKKELEEESDLEEDDEDISDVE